MSADSVIPNPNDTYSYDRYAYCRNNPVNLTDLTGHFGLGDLLKLIAIAVIAYFTAGAVTAALAQSSATAAGAAVGTGATAAGTTATAEATISASTAAATTPAAGGTEAAATVATATSAASSTATAATHAPLWAKMVGKATGEAVGSLASGERNPKNIMLSAISGAAYAGIDVQFKGNWTVTRVMEETAVSTVTTAGQGGDVGKGALFAAGSSFANLAYQKVVDYSATPKAGKGWTPKKLGVGAKEGYSNFGLSFNPEEPRQGLSYFFSERSAAMQAMDKIPTFEAIAAFHDQLMAPLDSASKIWRRVLNVPLMVPPAAISSVAIIGQSPAALAYVIRPDNGEAGFSYAPSGGFYQGSVSGMQASGRSDRTGISGSPSEWPAW
jgi:hypothetical protein